MTKNEIRIVGGELKGRKISTLSGPAIRPTSDRVREALFDVLGSRVMESKVLDLFAGSGALGLEALSRGGIQAVLVERSPPARRIIRKNIERLGLADRAEVLPLDYAVALKKLSRRGERFDLVLADPPYNSLADSSRGGWSGLEKILFLLDSYDTVTATGVFILEHFIKSKDLILPKGWSRLRRLRYGQTCLTFYSPF